MLHSARLAVCKCWLRMQEATIWKRHTPEPVSYCLIGSHVCLLLFTLSCCCECFFIICSGVGACTAIL